MHTKKRILAMLFVGLLLFAGTALAASKVQDSFLDALIAKGAVVVITMTTGDKVETKIQAYDDEVIQVEAMGTAYSMLISKAAIAVIVPRDAF